MCVKRVVVAEAGALVAIQLDGVAPHLLMNTRFVILSVAKNPVGAANALKDSNVPVDSSLCSK